jgi:hypothetical protein
MRDALTPFFLSALNSLARTYWLAPQEQPPKMLKLGTVEKSFSVFDCVLLIGSVAPSDELVTKSIISVFMIDPFLYRPCARSLD